MVHPTIFFLLFSALASAEPVAYNSFSTTKCNTCQAIVTELQPATLRTRFAALCSDETCPELAGLPSEINAYQLCRELKICPHVSRNVYKLQDLDICQTCAVAANFVIDNVKDPDHLAMVESILDTVCMGSRCRIVGRLFTIL